MVGGMVDGLRVKIIRESKGFSQLQLARKCKVSQQMIGMIEQDKTDGTISTLKKIADALGVTVDDLLKKVL